MSEVIGKVASIDGEFYARNSDGIARLLNRGDEIYVNEVVVGSNSNTPINSVIITTIDNTDIVILCDESPR